MLVIISKVSKLQSSSTFWSVVAISDNKCKWW
jgi:hypothetical protein